MEFFVTSLVNGLLYGMLLFMVSAGLTLIFGMMGVLNFAHASFYMLGAYFGYSLSGFMPFWLTLLVAPLLVAIIGMFVERYILRAVHQYGHMHEVLVTFGLGYIIHELIKMVYGNYAVSYQSPEAWKFSAFTLFDTTFPFYRVMIAIVGTLMFTLLALMLRFTRVGIVIRAAIRLPKMVEALGHNVPAVFILVFGIGAWLAGMAGTLGGIVLVTSPNMALDLGIIVFVVVIVGGLGSLEGALLASLLIGLVATFTVGIQVSIADLLGYLGWANASQASGLMAAKIGTFAAAVPMLIMLVVLLIRPAGLMGEKQ